MSDHSDLKKFLDSLDKMLDTVTQIVYTARCKIRVEQLISENDKKTQEEVSAPAAPAAILPTVGQGGPELFPGTTKQRNRSTQETEKILVRGGRMEVPHGRT